jgi:protein-tyrosine phosphatase
MLCFGRLVGIFFFFSVWDLVAASCYAGHSRSSSILFSLLTLGNIHGFATETEVAGGHVSRAKPGNDVNETEELAFSSLNLG